MSRWVAQSSAAAPMRLPEATVPAGLGVNIHFTGAPSRDLDMLQAAGFRFVRMDFAWGGIERQKGVYDFKPYDELTESLTKRGVRALYILDYSNSLYESEQSVRTEAGRQAFARFAATAAARYRGKGILWELWNEPNISFWQPQPGVEDYMALAKVVFPAIRQSDPNALRVAPATSGVDFDYLEGCFKRGLLNLVDAVTVHPYRGSPPETVAADILRLRALIARYRPDRPDLPIISGEWGYSSVWGGFEAERQGQYLPRELLTNLSLGLPLSIWYDWHDDGPDPKEPEHHFGTVTLDYKPKPAYLAMQRLTQALEGLRFVKRLQSSREDYLLLFSNDEPRFPQGHRDRGERHTLAAWTTAAPHVLEWTPGQKVELSATPQYLPVPPSAASLIAEGAWKVETRSVGVRGGMKPADLLAPISKSLWKSGLAPRFVVRVRNPFPHAVKVHIGASPAEGLEGKFTGPTRFALEPGKSRELSWSGVCRRRNEKEQLVTVTVGIDGNASRQELTFLVINPIGLRLVPYRGKLMAMIEHTAGDTFEGTLLAKTGDLKCSLRIRLRGDPRQSEVTPLDKTAEEIKTLIDNDHIGVSLPLSWHVGQDIAQVELLDKGVVAADSGPIRLMPLTVNADTAGAFNDGDAKVPAKFDLKPASYSDARDAPAEAGLAFTYKYDKGWKFVRIAPASALPVEAAPRAMGVWVRGDESGNYLRMRFVDKNGRTFQPDFGRLDFSGWRFLTAKMDDPNVGHWGGVGDESRIAYPIRIDSFILVDSRGGPVEGAIDLSSFCLMYPGHP